MIGLGGGRSAVAIEDFFFGCAVFGLRFGASLKKISVDAAGTGLA